MIKQEVFQQYDIDFDNYNKVYIPNMSLVNKMTSKKYKKTYTSTVYGAFDTETSYNIEHLDNKKKKCFCWINSWQLALSYRNQLYGYQGRDIRTFALFLGNILNRDYGERVKLRLWVHNLNYDLEYIYQTLKMFYTVEIFVKNPHDYLYMLVKGENFDIEFMDSFALMPKSLARLCNDYDVFHKKLDNYDYKEQIFSDTPLREEQKQYDMYDVYALCEIMQGYMQTHELFNTTDKVPYTQTGQVRKYLENNFKKDITKNREIMYNLYPTNEEYLLSKASYSGGITHVNTIYANKLVYVPNGEIIHADIKSSYPYSILSGTYPTHKGVFLEPKSVTFEDLNSKMYIATLVFVGLRSRVGFPNLSISKCECTNPYTDNGKIIFADTCYTTITSVDFKIVQYCYTWDSIHVVNFLYYERTGSIPEWIAETTRQFFIGKENTPKDTPDGAINYAINKELLNSIYGCLASAKDHTELILNDDINDLEKTEVTEESLTKELANEYKRKYSPYLCTWITAYSRLSLYRGIASVDRVAPNSVIYTDTDSLFIKAENDAKSKAIRGSLEELNEKIKQNSFSVTNYKGKTSTLGVWEFEDTDENGKGIYNKFVGIHAKAYAMGKDDDTIQSMTLAGVTAKNKKSGITREQECKTFTNFMNMNEKGKGFTFIENGGVTCGHITDTPHMEKINGHLQWVASGGIILDTVKQISFNQGENFIATKILNNSIHRKDHLERKELNL